MRRALLAAIVGVLCACGPDVSATATPSPTVDLTARPASPVTISIVSPTNGQVIHGKSVHVVVGIGGGTVVQQTSTDPDPTKGHVHVFLQNQLILMSYTLVQDVPVSPGQSYVMHAEWVASDHFPFYPRDVTPDIFFTVASG